MNGDRKNWESVSADRFPVLKLLLRDRTVESFLFLSKLLVDWALIVTNKVREIIIPTIIPLHNFTFFPINPDT
jgi:hypothetical protein